ncbi:D-alanyl-D-alanine carboxypeptidase/D-alanyl-D-alanine-endopeptidase [Thiomonas sp.]|jgi:D-alanyl-D-alanine carboxypeptidase/D-alanyl-D-alanine-endopeptidase (penicillin-binding protein 4)|uniref:D-alanyl-D-alanine carboxypeptidase/D-alanyl-D-alanine endopeptidase n=1 Tax=Thiomonas sp. TaxID=2047785 RepID=UPI00261443B4|nr:D-alanyl-D-alanine carboxypeptidase/D-alanyl-D-alanine-endopeptidase [Thiomonas sp.]
MRPSRRRFLASTLALTGAPLLARAQQTAWGSSAALPADVAQALDTARIPLQSCAFVLQALDSAVPQIEVNAAAPMNPASVLKLVTTYSALRILGPAYVWKTPVYAVGPLRAGVLHGDLAFVGSGDPHLMADNLWSIALRLRDLGLRRIDGDVLIDRQAFDLPPHDPAAFDGDATAPYNVGPDAFLVNFGVLRLGFVPDAQARAVRVTVEPPLAGFDLRETPRLSTTACGNWKDKLGADWRQPFAPRFSGSYAAACGTQTWNIAPQVSDNAYVQRLLGALFAQVGIAWQGRVRTAPLPATASELTVWESPALAVVVRDINKYSNNVMAQQVFLTLALAAGAQRATWAGAQQAVQQWLSTHGLPMPGLVLDNGCGLSRTARVSAADLNALLRAAWHSAVMPEFVASLPLAGEDGTLRRHFRDADTAGRIHAKTGSLDGVLTLAGYAQARSGRRYTFAALVNDPRAGGAWPALQAFVNSFMQTA